MPKISPRRWPQNQQDPINACGNERWSGVGCQRTAKADERSGLRRWETTAPGRFRRWRRHVRILIWWKKKLISKFKLYFMFKFWVVGNFPQIMGCNNWDKYYLSMSNLNNMHNTVYSVEQSRYNHQGSTPLQDSRTNRSFVDNKPMIQGLVRSVLKV